MTITPTEFLEDLDGKLKSDPARTQGVTAEFQFVIDGAAGGSWWVDTQDGTGSVTQGSCDKPAVTVKMADHVFVRLITGELSGADAYMDGLIFVTGDQSKVMFLPQLFDQ